MKVEKKMNMYINSRKKPNTFFLMHTQWSRYQSGNGKMEPHSDSDNKSNSTVTGIKRQSQKNIS